MLSINGAELVVLLAVAAVVLGPERLPGYAQQLGRLVREARRIASGAKEQVASEMGPEFEDIDWRKLDPRQYDPRRIVRDALADEATGGRGRTRSGATAADKPGMRPGGVDGHAAPARPATPAAAPDYDDAT